MRHATDPDHVIAVSTIVARHRSVRGAALIGAAWGLGHTLTILLVGGGIVLLGWVIPPRVGLSLELSVGVMLVILGLVNVRSAWRATRSAAGHSHAHAHGDFVHTHPHEHAPERHPHRESDTPVSRLDRRLGSLAGYRLVRPLVIGMVHGLAGSAAVALLVLAAIGEPGWAALYLGVFGLGTIAGMMLVTAALALPMTWGSGARLSRALGLASGVVSIGFGLWLAYRVGLVDGLFTGDARWTPG
jgi:high-affinity nickel-transport protein